MLAFGPQMLSFDVLEQFYLMVSYVYGHETQCAYCTVLLNPIRHAPPVTGLTEGSA